MTKLYKPDPGLPEAFIFDIDGTVADHIGIRGHYDYDKVHLDKPVGPVIEVVKALRLAGLYPIAVSGRMNENDGDVLKKTRRWINTNIGFEWWDYDMHLRNDQDFRADDIVKEEIFWKFITPAFNVRLVLDDRKRVVDMWRRIGLQCLQVASGDF